MDFEGGIGILNASLIRLFILSVLGVVLIVTGASAVRPYHPTHPDPVLESWRWRTIPELKGVSVLTVAPDGKGNVWFGTDEGVWRSDGVHWRVFTTRDSLLSTSYRALCVARDGSVYAGGVLGVSRYRDGGWKRVFPPKKGELRWFVNKITESSDGGLWVATVWGALRLKGEEATLYTSAPVRDALQAIAPGLKFVTVPEEVIPVRPLPRGMGLRMAPVPSDTNEFQVIYVAPGGPAEKAGLRVGDRVSPGFSGLFGRARDPVTVTIRREGVEAPFQATVSQSQSEGQFRDFTFFEVYEDRNGGIWFGLDRGEIIRYLPGARGSGEKEWRLYTGRDSLEIGFAPRFLQTRDGSLWTISRHGMKGVNRFNGRSWERFRLISMDGEESNFVILETRDGTIWIGGRGTLHAYRGGAWTVYRFPDVPIPSDVISGLAETPDGALWITGGGVTARLDFGMERWTTYEGLNFQGETPDGAQWFISQDEGVVRYDGRTWERYGVEDGLMQYPCRLITTREGMVWVAGSHDATAATARFDGSRWTLQTHPRLGMSLRSVYESADGSVWFGVQYGSFSQEGLGGVLQFGGKALRQNSGEAWTHHVPPDAPSDYIYDIGQSTDGMMWFGGLQGLSRFDPSSDGKRGTKAWTSVTEPKAWMRTIHAVYGTPEGQLWVGGGGVARFDGKQWTSYGVRNGLAHEFIENFLRADDGSIYAATGQGISRFDGRTWTTQAV
ncbi:MAG: hypothetical protein O2954_14770, partial [bacterium]|nr:hypothetical protein [bacterium]